MSTHKPVRILGGTPQFEGEPKILDQTTKQEPQQVDVRVHEDHVVTDDKLRKEPKKEGDPEIRVRHTTGSFESVKRDEDENDS